MVFTHPAAVLAKGTLIDHRFVANLILISNRRAASSIAFGDRPVFLTIWSSVIVFESSISARSLANDIIVFLSFPLHPENSTFRAVIRTDRIPSYLPTYGIRVGR
jgi:hypothetical protein